MNMERKKKRKKKNKKKRRRRKKKLSMNHCHNNQMMNALKMKKMRNYLKHRNWKKNRKKINVLMI
jgi:hypothetical protein